MSASALERPAAVPDVFTGFVQAFGRLLDGTADEAGILARGGALLADLVSRDDWLPDAYAAPDPARYRQYLLHRDAAMRFSVVSFVWGPGQATPVHDHKVWGLIGMLRGAERAERFVRAGDGRPVAIGEVQTLRPGDIDAVSPRIGDIHRVANAHDDRVSVSIHVYGADIGQIARTVYDADGVPRHFVSGYADRPPLIA